MFIIIDPLALFFISAALLDIGVWPVAFPECQVTTVLIVVNELNCPLLVNNNVCCMCYGFVFVVYRLSRHLCWNQPNTTLGEGEWGTI